MKKILIVLVSILIIPLIILFIKNKSLEKEDSFSNEFRYITNYKKENLDRYIMFRDKYSNLSLEDIVLRVNIGLDRPYYTNTRESNLLNKNYIMVNKYIYLPSNYVPNDLVNLDLKYSRSGMMLVKEAKVNFEKMYYNALKDGYNIRIVSSYRSYNYQVNLYNKYVETDGKEVADTYSARPGFSEHQTGLCVDIDDKVISYDNFSKSRSYLWMKKNSYKYGFIERYPKGKEDITGYSYEAWHYRYVGLEIAKYIYENNITFDEYFFLKIKK